MSGVRLLMLNLGGFLQWQPPHLTQIVLESKDVIILDLVPNILFIFQHLLTAPMPV